MDTFRTNPDELLMAIRREDEKSKRGHLKIFFGYAAGVGKTYAMLQAAHAAKKRGTDVAVGYIEPHARQKTAELLKGLEQIPNRTILYNHLELKNLILTLQFGVIRN